MTRRSTLVAGVFLVALAALVLREFASLPKEILLPDGSRLKVVAVTCGTNHIGGSPLGRLVARLPQKAREVLVRYGGERFNAMILLTPAWEMRVWYSVSPPPITRSVPPPPYSAILANQEGVVAGEGAPLWRGIFPNSTGFRVVPRRSREIELRISDQVPGSDQAPGEDKPSLLGSLRFKNPVYKSYPQWTPQSLPATNIVDDLEVVLEQFGTGHGMGISRNAGMSPANRRLRSDTITFSERVDGEPPYSSCILKTRSLEKTNATWIVTQIHLSDATGNQIPMGGLATATRGLHRMAVSFGPSLWPEESAWRLEFDLRRTGGFSDSELVTFKRIPLPEVGRTNFVLTSQKANGVKVTLDHIIRRAPSKDPSIRRFNESSEVHLRYDSLAPGVYCDVAGLITDTGKRLANVVTWSVREGEVMYQPNDIPLDARTVDIVIAVHRGRTVSFLVKPETKERLTIEYEEP